MCEAESGENRHDVCVVGEIKVDGLVQGKGGGVIVQCSVDLGARVTQGMVLKTGDYFLDIADSNSATSRRSEGTSTRKVKVNCVFEADPFFIGE